MKIFNRADIEENEFAALAGELSRRRTLGPALAWAAAGAGNDSSPLPEVVTQDEYTHDVIVPYREWFLVFDTT